MNSRRPGQIFIRRWIILSGMILSLLMLAKVLLSAFMFGSVSAILYSLTGGILSLAVMLLVRKNPGTGVLIIGILTAASELVLLRRVRIPQEQMLWCMILIAAGCLAAFAIYGAIRKNAVTY